ncbi:MAG: helix-turn-helix domain-containing protein [Bacteroidia bacterium]|nr:helix-turn-helix domain-containing protein [Bacteroidia bacterium]
MNYNKEKFNTLVSAEKSVWHEKVQFRRENKDWLDLSAEIAITVLRTLRSKGMSQKELADKMGVSPQYIHKIVKGNENLSLETICKLEKYLGVSLLYFNSYQDINPSTFSDTPKILTNQRFSASSEYVTDFILTMDETLADSNLSKEVA